MEHPGEASTPFQGCILFGTVNGTIGKRSSTAPFSVEGVGVRGGEQRQKLIR